MCVRLENRQLNRVFSFYSHLLISVISANSGLRDAKIPKNVYSWLDCKTVGFFLKISKEVGKAWRKSITRAKRASLTRP